MSIEGLSMGVGLFAYGIIGSIAELAAHVAIVVYVVKKLRKKGY